MIYEPDKLNKLLLVETDNVARTFGFIQVLGDIKDVKIWRRGGCSCKLSLNNKSVDCKIWTKCGISPEDVQNYENTRCIISGRLVAEYFNGHKFTIEVSKIELQNNDTKLNQLKKICAEKSLFKNKKPINWENVNKIGILSKKATQGYDDFCNQLKVPIPHSLLEITLEGCNTASECKKGLVKLQDCDIIIIIRGGGDTAEISNSFDNIELFETIRNSKIPVITAIGHEQDKGDKLLITNVSDIDFPTPTALAKDLNLIFYQPVLRKLDKLIRENDEMFNDLIRKENGKLYKGLECLVNEFLRNKFGAQIINVTENETNIIVQRGKQFFNIPLTFKNKLNLTEKDVLLRDKLLEALDEEDIKKVSKYFKELDVKPNDLSKNVFDFVKQIKEQDKIETKFEEVKPKKIEKLYLKKTGKIKKVSNLMDEKSMLMFYKEVLENGSDNGEIYQFIKN